jgi:precorrin-2 dehydrogenase/sirohydrochlorin ferrochelatase
MRKFYPIFLDAAGRKAVVIGGGAVAARKARTLTAAGATVTVISPELGASLTRMAERGAVTHVPRKYRKGDLAGALLAVAATDDPRANMKAAEEASERGVLLNCARPPDAGNFIVPSSVTRGGLTVAIATGGGCPALSKRLRKDLDVFLGREYGPFLEFLEGARAVLKESLLDDHKRGEALTALVDSDLLHEFRDGMVEQARKRGAAMLEELIARLGR